MAARTTTSSFSFLKEPLLFLQRNTKVLNPLLLFSMVAFSVTAVKIVYVVPLTAEMARHITQMEETTDRSSPEYAGLLEEVRQEATEVLLISVAIALVLLTLAFAKQIVACFTTLSGDRCSLSEILRGVVKYAKGPLIAAAVVTMLQATFAALVNAYFDALSEPELLSVLGVLVFLSYSGILWSGDAAMMIVAASVVDDVQVSITLTGEGWPSVRGLREACRLITEVMRMEGFVLGLVTPLLPTVLIPLYAVALLYTSTGMGLCLLSADKYCLLSGVYGLCYVRAASVYACQGYHYLQAMESKEVVVASDDYAQIPSGEPQVIVN